MIAGWAERVLDPAGELVIVRVAARPGEALELVGELPHWAAPLPLRAVAGHAAEARLRLAPGIYEYKLRGPAGDWRLDPDNPRTRGRDGNLNNVLVVGGAPEPVLHAPAAPWLVVRRDGRLVVRAALRRGAGDGLALRWNEGAGVHTTGMAVVGAEDRHVLVEAELPASGRAVEYVFELVDGGRRRVIGDGARAFVVEPARLRPATPAWWQGAVVYSIFVDRFRVGGSRGRWPAAPADDRARRGGDLDGVVEALPYLADLGVTALHLTPVWCAPSAHRYDVVDPFAVDPALGGEAAFDRLVAAAERAALRLILDVTLTHVHRDFAPFLDVRERGPLSPYWTWFRGRRFPFGDGPEPGYEHYHKGRWDLPLLALDEPEVADHLTAVCEHWIRRGGHGLRLDAAADVPLPLVARLAAAARSVRRDAAVFGEIVPDTLERWAGALDGATEFAWRNELVGFLGGGPGGRAFADRLAARRPRRGDGDAVVFASNHDLPRVASALGRAAGATAQAVTLAAAGTPILYYGDELGLASADAGRELDDAWPDRMVMPWDGGERALAERTRALVRLRAQHAALQRGDMIALPPSDGAGAEVEDALWLRRRAGHQVIDVIAARGRAVELQLDAGDARLLFGPGEITLAADEAGPRVRLAPWSVALLERSAPDPLVELGTDHAALAGRAFAEGSTLVPGYPTRLYLTVTEACNLRCAHCITEAPTRTRDGRARTMRPWLIDALEPSLARASYLAFTHGGESLTAPILFDLLAAAARVGHLGPRRDIHLVTNGTRLGPDVVRRLVGHGVTSLMVSLDGASAATNDRIRVGGSFVDVVANLRGAVAARDAGADLRVGISTVVGASNRHELDALAGLAIDLGVDWLKLEETYPATSFARRDRIAPDAAELTDAVARVGQLLAAAGLTLVDHLAPSPRCPCGAPADDPVHAFRTADDLANRFRYRPCRVAWEQVAIDPDGLVHAIDYAGPALGSLIDQPMLELWNGPIAEALRARALIGTDQAGRAACLAS